MVAQSQQVEWLSLVETSGPFLTLTVLEQAFPQGLESIEPPRRQQLRSAYSEWREAVDEDDELLPQLHDAWVNLVLTEMLEFDEESATPHSSWVGGDLSVSSPDGAAHHGPTWIIHAPGSTDPRAFIAVTRPDADLESAAQTDGWIASEVERMTLLCREHGVRVGIVTNGESWVLINAPTDAPSGKAVWRSRFWFQEPATLKAFQSLLGVRRCFGPTDQTLEALLDESLKHQEEVTDTLGEQVRRATEVLIQALDKADQDRNRELLHDVPPTLLYEASLTVMMRLVFVLCAEERGLLLLGDPVYDENFAVSTLRGKLAEEADQLGDEVLERRYDAWARLLAAFRAVYAGIEHEDLRLPAMGGSLFDPDRFPFLEGRALGTSWMDTVSQPLPIDNRTVLLLLNSLQVLEQSHGALALSYRALDVEQIGHVYEGLLDHTVVRVPDTTLGLKGASKSRYPTLSLASLESLRLEGQDALVAKVGEATGRMTASIRNELTRPPSDALLAAVLNSANGDRVLSDRIKPFANLLRSDAWGEPIIYRDQSFMVTVGADRRESGTHYTPRSLTEQIVNVALEPLVYTGPAEGRPRDQWILKPPKAILDLKVCDPAMGSGAFLVQACRYLADRLVEAWAVAEASGCFVNGDGDVVDALDTWDPLPAQADERINVARRLVAQRCLYGVDINPLAVELAKLSIWLVTLSEGKPFGFLDHNLRSGDSLLGIHSVEQLVQMRLNPVRGERQIGLLDDVVSDAVRRAAEVRKRLRSGRELDITDVRSRAVLNQEAHEITGAVDLVADAFLSEVFRRGPASRGLNGVCDGLALTAAGALEGNQAGVGVLRSIVRNPWGPVTDGGASVRDPFHWALEFPEVVAAGGFDAVFGNPPFVDSETMAQSDPLLRQYLSGAYLTTKGNWDLYVPFIERAIQIARPGSPVFMISPNKWLAAPYGSALREFTASSLNCIIDFSEGRAFANAGVAAISAGFGLATDGDVRVRRPGNQGADISYVPRSQVQDWSNWGFLLSKNIDVLTHLASSGRSIGDFASASDPFTVAEAYRLRDWVTEATDTVESFRLINTGTVDPFVSLWGTKDTRYLKKRFVQPVVAKEILAAELPRRFTQAANPKLILSGMRKFEAFWDRDGSYVAGKSSVIVVPRESDQVLPTLLGILNSRLMRFYVQEAFGALGIDGGISFSGAMIEQLPMPMSSDGRVVEIEKSVAVVLDTMPDSEQFEHAVASLDRAVLHAYSVSPEMSARIEQAEIRC